MNQHGKQELQRMTLSVDPSSAQAITAAGIIDARIRQMLRQVQPEGARLMRSRSTSGEGMVETSYYMPTEVASAVRTAAEEEMANVVGDKSNALRLTSMPVILKTLTAVIRSPRVKAEIARMARVGGGFMEPGLGGVSKIGVPEDVVTEKGANLMRSISSRISSAERDWKKQHGELLGEDSDVVGSEAPGAAPNARRGTAGKAVKSEKDLVYEALARKNRRAGIAEQYAKDSPEDRFVKKRAAAAEKALDKAKKTAGKRARGFVGRVIVTSLSAIATAAVTTIGLLRTIKDVTVEIGSMFRTQRKQDVALNLNEGTTRRWQIFADKRGMPKDLLPNALGELQGMFASELLYSNENFIGLAKVIGANVSKMTELAKAGGADNAQELLDTIGEYIVSASARGITTTSPGGGMAPAKALAQNLAVLRKANPAAAKIIEQYGFDFLDSGASTLEEWRIDTPDGKRRMTMRNWYDRRGDPIYDTNRNGSGVSGEADKRSAEELALSWKNYLVTNRTFFEDLITRMSVTFIKMLNGIENFTTKILAPFFPAFAAAQAEKAATINIGAAKLVEANLPGEQKDAERIMKKYGLGGLGSVDTVLNNITNPDYVKRNPRILDLLAEDGAIQKLIAYSDTMASKEFLSKQLNEEIPTASSYNPSTHGASVSARAGQIRRKVGNIAGYTVALPFGNDYNDLRKFFGGDFGEDAVENFVAGQDKIARKAASEVKPKGYYNYIKLDEAYMAKEKIALARAFASGDSEETRTAVEDYKSYFSQTEKNDNLTDSRKRARQNRMEAFDKLLADTIRAGRLGSLNLEARGEAQVENMAYGDAYQAVSQVNMAFREKGFRGAKSLAEALDKNIGNAESVRLVPEGGEDGTLFFKIQVDYRNVDTGKIITTNIGRIPAAAFKNGGMTITSPDVVDSMAGRMAPTR